MYGFFGEELSKSKEGAECEIVLQSIPERDVIVIETEGTALYVCKPERGMGSIEK
jgi:hypothetical protein